MKVGHRGLGGALAALVVASASPAFGSTGICDSDAAHSQLCIDEIQSAGGVVNDIFKDAQGLTGPQLPVFAKLFDNWPGCMTTFAGCAGTDTAPYDCPGQYTCAAPTPDFATASQFLNSLDHTWWHPCRSATSGFDANGCPNRACITDGVGGNYNPWEGLVFDLGGPSNQVVIFATNDHGPQPCESTEYTVFLSDNPNAQTVIEHPTTDGADPQKWNRAVLKKIFTEGWYQTRQPDPAGHGASCGDTTTYAVEQDSFVTVYALPCGITFRYAAIVAGNDGIDFPDCAYDSSEAELDAVAGLTEGGNGVCPDTDKDGFVDCNCTGAPAVCDCNDADPSVHPGAPEPCDSPDVNCDGVPGSCQSGLFCVDSVCVPPCGSGELGSCPAGSSCQDTEQGKLCVPGDCTTGSCPAGSVCDPSTKTCKPACDGVTCPYGQKCQDGQCKDLCAGVVCPNDQQCHLGVCKPRCDCFNGDVGCVDTPGLSCDRGGTNQCVPPACVGKTCGAGQHCDDTGTCVGFCDGVTCPAGQKCVAPTGCVSNCDGVTCPSGQTCDPATGACQDAGCSSVCIPPSVCVAGACVAPEGGTGPDAGVDSGASGGSGGGSGGGPSRGSASSGDSGGCGCRVAGLPAPGRGTFAAALALLALGLRRRRRS